MAHALRHTCILSIVSLFGMGTTVQAAPPPAAPTDLAVTAWMDLGDVIVEVNVNGTKDWGRPDADGRVDLVLPADAVALIHFRKAGHLTKTVSVDTHNMSDASFNGRRHSISFGVRMDATASEDLAYAGPVGSIAFDLTSGELLIEQDQHLVPVRQQTVVF